MQWIAPLAPSLRKLIVQLLFAAEDANLSLLLAAERARAFGRVILR